MSPTDTLAAAQALWTDLASVPILFPASGLTVVTAPASRLCPPGCVGLVCFDRSAMATAPDDATAEFVRIRLARVPLPDLTMATAGGVIDALQPTAVLGPTALAYLNPADFRPATPPSGLTAEQLPTAHDDLRALERRCPQADQDEAGIDEITSPVLAIRDHGTVIAAAGYVRWCRTRHPPGCHDNRFAGPERLPGG
jgi:hypothetical protein